MRLNELVAALRSSSLRLRTGLWLVSDAYLGRETDITSCLPSRCDMVDLRQVVLQHRGEQARFAQITPTHVRDWVDGLHQADLQCDCAILTQVDLVLSALTADERNQTWEMFRVGYPRRPRALIFALPQKAAPILIEESLVQLWRQNQRLAEE